MTTNYDTRKSITCRGHRNKSEEKDCHYCWGAFFTFNRGASSSVSCFVCLLADLFSNDIANIFFVFAIITEGNLVYFFRIFLGPIKSLNRCNLEPLGEKQPYRCWNRSNWKQPKSDTRCWWMGNIPTQKVLSKEPAKCLIENFIPNRRWIQQGKGNHLWDSYHMPQKPPSPVVGHQLYKIPLNKKFLEIRDREN